MGTFARPRLTMYVRTCIRTYTRYRGCTHKLAIGWTSTQQDGSIVLPSAVSCYSPQDGHLGPRVAACSTINISGAGCWRRQLPSFAGTLSVCWASRPESSVRRSRGVELVGERFRAMVRVFQTSIEYWRYTTNLKVFGPYREHIGASPQ